MKREKVIGERERGRDRERKETTRRKKEVPLHNRTHKTFLSIARVQTPRSDSYDFINDNDENLR